VPEEVSALGTGVAAADELVGPCGDDFRMKLATRSEAEVVRACPPEASIGCRFCGGRRSGKAGCWEGAAGALNRSKLRRAFCRSELACSGTGVFAEEIFGDMIADGWCGCGPVGVGEKMGDDTEGR